MQKGGLRLLFLLPCFGVSGLLFWFQSAFDSVSGVEAWGGLIDANRFAGWLGRVFVFVFGVWS